MLLVLVCSLAATGSVAASAAAARRAPAANASAVSPRAPAGSWLTFDYNQQRSGTGPARTGITRRDLHSLRRLSVGIPGTVDSSPIELSGVQIGGRKYDVTLATTSYGDTFALNTANGRLLWQFFPAADRRLQGSAQITTATPVADRSGRDVFVATPDGFISKLSVSTGRPLWRTRVSWLPSREKLAGALNLTDGELIVTTGGYFGDTPPYQGHVVTLNPASGRITHVWNALCSNVTHLIHDPGRCAGSDAAVWGRPGSVVERNGTILVATGNGPFDGRRNWGDSVLELSPSLRLLHNWTPRNQSRLERDDLDLGSSEPALLAAPGQPPLALQAGKDGELSLLSLSRLDGTGDPAGPRTGGELERVAAPGSTDVFSQPAVWRHGASDYAFVANADGTACYELSRRRLRLLWQDSDAGTSPLVAGGLLYVYDMNAGVLDVRDPLSGRLYAALPAAPGHWNSPIVVGGRIILPVGDDNAHQTHGTLYIYRVRSKPGR